VLVYAVLSFIIN